MTTPTTQPMDAAARRAEIRRARSRALGAALAAAIACAAVGYFPTVRMAGDAAGVGMCVALVIGMIGSAAAMLPTLAAMNREPLQWVSGAMIGLALRFGLTLGLGVAAAFSEIWPRNAVLLWIGIAQLVFLATDTAIAVRAARRVLGSES